MAQIACIFALYTPEIIVSTPPWRISGQSFLQGYTGGDIGILGFIWGDWKTCSRTSIKRTWFCQYQKMIVVCPCQKAPVTSTEVQREKPSWNPLGGEDEMLATKGNWGKPSSNLILWNIEQPSLLDPVRQLLSWVNWIVHIKHLY